MARLRHEKQSLRQCRSEPKSHRKSPDAQPATRDAPSGAHPEEDVRGYNLMQVNCMRKTVPENTTSRHSCWLEQGPRPSNYPLRRLRGTIRSKAARFKAATSRLSSFAIESRMFASLRRPASVTSGSVP